MQTPPKDLLDAAKTLIKNAYAPYSHFSVAAAIRAKDGQIFTGCNVENASYSLTLCAESGAISNLIASNQHEIIEALVLVDSKKICPPCGACRQRLLEFAATDYPVHLCTVTGDYQQYSIKTLLPAAFGPYNLE